MLLRANIVVIFPDGILGIPGRNFNSYTPGLTGFALLFVLNPLQYALKCPQNLSTKKAAIQAVKRLFEDFCGLVGIRTPNLLIRSEVLYPIELQIP
jgi:hypothetical protein